MAVEMVSPSVSGSLRVLFLGAMTSAWWMTLSRISSSIAVRALMVLPPPGRTTQMPSSCS